MKMSADFAAVDEKVAQHHAGRILRINDGAPAASHLWLRHPIVEYLERRQTSTGSDQGLAARNDDVRFHANRRGGQEDNVIARVVERSLDCGAVVGDTVPDD